MKKPADKAAENAALKARLAAAEEVVAAIRHGAVDAVITDDQRVFVLEGAEHAYRVLVETMGEGAAALTPDGTVLYCNKRLADMLGRPEGKIVGGSILDLIEPDWLSNVRSALRRSRNGPTRVEAGLKVKGGATLPVLVSCKTLQPASAGLCLVVTDLTAQKSAEQELRERRDLLEEQVAERTAALQESEERIHAVFKALAEGVVHLDPRGAVVETNDSLKLVLGRTLQELLDPALDPRWRIIRNDGRPFPMREQPAMVALRTGKAVRNVEMGIPQPEGAIKWVSASARPVQGVRGKPFGAVASFFDITARKRIEDALQISETRYRRLFETAQDGIMILDADTGVIIEVNPSLLEMLGYPHPAYIGRKVWEIECIQDLFLTREEFRTLQQRKTTRRDDRSLRTADGRILAVEFVSNVYQVDHTKVIQCNIRDITLRRRLERELQRYRKNLEQQVLQRTTELAHRTTELHAARRLSDIGTLAATVAHELRNPLAAIRMAAYNIRRKANLPVLDSHLATIEKKVTDSDQIIKNLLFYSRIKSPDYQSFDIGALLDETIEQTANRYRRTRQVITKAYPELANRFIEADPLLLRELIENVLSNAMDAIDDEHGTVDLSGAINDAGALAIRVADNGTGIDPEKLSDVFEPFFSTKSKGTGLGLAVCRQIAQLHGGSIGIASEQGRGTIVLVTIPVTGSRA